MGFAMGTASDVEKLSLGVRLTYGFGAVAYGIKDNGFAYFLLLFYGTVVGLEPALAGTALLIALVFDSLSDPIVGYWSDNTRSRWRLSSGRTARLLTTIEETHLPTWAS